MTIELLGLSAVKIQSKDTVILLAPPSQKSEARASRMKADCVVLGAPEDKVNVDAKEDKIFIIDSAGEYEYRGIFVYCAQNPSKGKPVSLMSLINIEGVLIAHLARLGHKLDDKQMELLEGADILMVPVGGHGVLDSKAAKEEVERIEPRIVIPMHFAQKGLKTAFDTPEKFFKEIGATPQEQEKAKITKSDLPQETMETLLLSM